MSIEEIAHAFTLVAARFELLRPIAVDDVTRDLDEARPATEGFPTL